MICVYPADCTDFSTNGNGTLAPLSAEVTETLNGEYELTLVHPIDEAGKWQRLVEGCILRAPVPAAMTPRVNFTAPGDDNRTEVWRVNTDFSGAETRKGTLRLRSGPGTKYKVLATYKNGSFVQVIAKTNSSWYEVTAPDGKHGYMHLSGVRSQGRLRFAGGFFYGRGTPASGSALPHLPGSAGTRQDHGL